MTLMIHPVSGIPEITQGIDLGTLIGDACSSSEFGLTNGDVLVVTQKIVSKAEGAMVEIDQNDHEAHRIMGAISLQRSDFELALHHQERAMELCPSDAYIMGKNAALLVYLGKPEKALEIVQHAMRINPFCPDDLFVDEGMCYFWLEKYSNAANCFRKIKTPSRESLFYFAATLFKLEEEKKSAETLKQAFKMTDMSVEDFLVTQHYQNPELNQQLQEILQSIPI